MPFNHDSHIIFEKYVSITEKVTLENIMDLLQKKNEKVASKILEMDQTPSKGHVLKLAKFFNEVNNLDALSSYYTKFLELKKRNRIEDITSFKTFHDFENRIDALEKQVKLVMPQSVEETEKPVYQDNNVKIFLGENQGKCVKLGNNYSFCISRTSGNMYSSYRLRDQSSFYFVRFLNRTDEKLDNGDYKDPAHLIVIDALPNDEYKWTWADNGRQGHGTQDVSKKAIVKEFPELKPAFDKNIFQAKPLEKEEKSKIEKFDDLSNDFNLKTFQNLPYVEKEEFLQRGNVKLPFQAWQLLDKNLRNEYLKNITDFDAKIYEDLKGSEIKVFENQMKKDDDAGFEYFLYLNKLN